MSGSSYPFWASSAVGVATKVRIETVDVVAQESDFRIRHEGDLANAKIRPMGDAFGTVEC
jgi:hypothetical protein